MTKISSLAALISFGLAAAAGSAFAQVKIGVFGPMSGDAAGYGQSLREATEMVVAEKNAKGGVLGQKIQLVIGDDAGKPEQAVSVAKRLATSDNVVIMLGSISSPASLAASQVAQQTQTPQIVISGTAQRITTQGNPWVFRSAVPDTKLAGDLADFVNDKFAGKKRIALLYVNDDFGRGGIEGFKTRAQKYGMQWVADEKYTRGDLDFTAQLARIKNANPDIVIEWSRYAEGALIAKQRLQAGVTATFLGSDGAAHPKYLELGGPSVNGIYYATHFSPSTVSGNKTGEAFIAQVKTSLKKDADYVHAQAFDAITAAIAAIEKAGSTDKTKIRDALRTVDFDGARGRFKFDQKGDPELATHIVLVKDGKETNGRN